MNKLQKLFTRLRRSNLVAALSLVLFVVSIDLNSSAVNAQDWPQWRHDAARSGATDKPCADRLTLQWTRDFGVPDPAYDHQYRMCADAANAPIAAGGLVFVPSNTDDSVTACDMDTGEVRWRYVCEAPVRFAPLYREGRVGFG
jgi:outer membrane protein assembly factor BamB